MATHSVALKDAYTNSLYAHAYMRGDTIQKQAVIRKLQYFMGVDADFVQVGDSSGYFGVQPDLIKPYIPGYNYINASCCADTGFAGYRYIAEALLRENHKAKYLVLHLNYYTMPLQYGEGFSPALYRALMSPFRGIDSLPSMRYRTRLLNEVYYAKAGDYPPYNDDQINAAWYRQDIQHSGWVAIPDAPVSGKDVPDKECEFDHLYDIYGQPTLKPELEKVKAVADRYHVKLIVLMNPIACTPGDKSKDVVDNLQAFLDAHPDVLSPMPLLQRYPRESFFDRWHLLGTTSVRHSKEIGQALAKVLADSKKQ